MPTILDYVKENAHKDFGELSLNSVDIAVLNELGYLPLGEGVDLNQPVSFQTLKKIFFAHDQVLAYSFTVRKERVDLLYAVLEAPRYQGLQLLSYVNEIDSEYEKQFAAMVVELPKIAHRQAIFRGTDETFIGWKEDFKMTYMSEIPAQRRAKQFLIESLEQAPYKLVLSGHSKGGNLALYAASQIESSLQNKIDQILILDAPGLHDRILESQGYQLIKDKILAIRPKESIVGVMLSSDVPSLLVDSKELGLFQHNVSAWEITGSHWKLAQGQTALSQTLEVTFRVWTHELSKQELKALFDTVFDLLLDNNITSIDVFQTDVLKSASLLLGALSKLPADKRRVLTKSTTSLLEIFIKSHREQLTLPSFKSLSGQFKNFFDNKE
ncbi:Mbeg1-like protein [Streptococcus dentapri]|uniref:Mbeg1-like protein n=1 Tax=Streptococcus dentapri TaxID=573564 RepID=A0ABV8CZ25_9STRE